jgi:hypothetical protein
MAAKEGSKVWLEDVKIPELEGKLTESRARSAALRGEVKLLQAQLDAARQAGGVTMDLSKSPYAPQTLVFLDKFSKLSGLSPGELVGVCAAAMAYEWRRAPHAGAMLEKFKRMQAVVR